MNKKISIIIILAFGFSFTLFFLFKEKDEPVTKSDSELIFQSIDIGDWGYYKNETIGIQFRYPGDDIINNNDTIDEVIGSMIVKAYPYNLEGLNEEDYYDYYEGSYKDLDGLIDDSSTRECNSLNIDLPIFGNRSLKETCLIFNSDNDVNIVLGFYENFHGEPPLVAFLNTEDHWILFILYYYQEEDLRYGLNSDEFINEIISGKYPRISAKINEFNNILKTIELIDER